MRERAFFHQTGLCGGGRRWMRERKRQPRSLARSRLNRARAAKLSTFSVSSSVCVCVHTCVRARAFEQVGHVAVQAKAAAKVFDCQSEGNH